MNNRLALDIMRGNMERTSDQANGLQPSPVRLSVHRAVATQFGDVSKLPVADVAEMAIQSGDNDTFMLGYSALGGGDVLA